ncbi:MAG TPA: multicopper oxidase domain-containing protein, partial [Actinomycetota bacterium]|nr:multicopper oxidase domain-containing protein [Actinomycetota bacterium]
MRRQRITFTTLLLATASILATAVTSFAAPLPGGTLDPLTVPKYVDALPIPGVMPATSTDATIDYYEIAVRQFQQQVLPTGLPLTTVWSYGSVNHLGTFSYPAFTIEATVGKPVKVKWMNQLVVDPVACAASPNPATDPACNFVPHLLPVDQTLHWANPPQDCTDGTPRPDCRGQSQLRYTGPVPVVTHLHGAHVQPDSDGYPEAWWLPAANNIPTGYATRGSNFDQIPGAPLEDGAALFQYGNDQRATALWFHDHSVGMTRSNVYAGPAGFYFLRGGAADVSSGVAGGLPGGVYEIPLVIQDRSFNTDGSLFYPDSRVFFDGYAGPYIGDPLFASDAAPLHNPEFFGNTMVVNGKTWPFLNVEPRKYRLRILNGSDSRFLILEFPANVKAKFTVIGTEGGFLPAPVVVSQLLVGPAERFDVIVDFTGLKPGAVFNLLNVGPDSPFGGPFPASGEADAKTTGQVMQLRVVALAAADTSAIPALPTITPVGAPTNVRQLSLNEAESALICVDKNNVFVPGVTPPVCGKRSAPLAPVMAQLGTIDPLTGLGIPKAFDDPITENVGLDSTEQWEISNFTADAHPIHLHLVMFQVVSRQPFGGVARVPEVWET